MRIQITLLTVQKIQQLMRAENANPVCEVRFPSFGFPNEYIEKNMLPYAVACPILCMLTNLLMVYRLYLIMEKLIG